MRFIGEPVTEDEIEVCYSKKWERSTFLICSFSINFVRFLTKWSFYNIVPTTPSLILPYLLLPYLLLPYLLLPYLSLPYLILPYMLLPSPATPLKWIIQRNEKNHRFLKTKENKTKTNDLKSLKWNKRTIFF